MSEVSAPPYRQRGAHKGYRYQDLVGALLAARILLDESGTLSIETGRFEHDPFDDLVTEPGARIQVKHSEGREEFNPALFTQAGSSLRIDKLIPGTTGGVLGSVRIVSTWTTPSERPEWLCPAEVEEFLPGIRSTCWRLSAETLWPEDRDPLWAPLEGEDRARFVALCEELVLELDCLGMSGTLAAPGGLESRLLSRLREELGVERHPNNRAADDVAGRLLEITGSARGREGRTFGYAELVNETGLRVDRGHVAQAYPLERERYIEPAELRTALGDAMAENQRVILAGPPGSGKSWALEALARDLRAGGTSVARHYCFLEPGDPDAQARVALETMASNLVFELLTDEKLEGLRAGLGADLNDLQRVIVKAHRRLAGDDDQADELRDDGEDQADVAEGGSTSASESHNSNGRNGGETDGEAGAPEIVLIVDGLDHIARVPVEGARPHWRPDDFVAALAELNLPDGVILVVGSQPGDHLDALRGRGASEVEVPPFDERMITAQLERLGATTALAEAGLDADVEAFSGAVYLQAAGNPLYATFLAREVAGLLASGELDVLPSQYVTELTTVPGDLPEYYGHLFAGTDDLAEVVAEHLSVIEFAVTESELAEMLLPNVGRQRIGEALRRLRPVLTRVAARGGYRIHHESLRRYVYERLAHEGPERVAGLLEPPIAWLDARGFFADERAFRHLLLSLFRAGRGAEALERFQGDFVARALEELQPRAAVEANLRLGARIAADLCDLETLGLLTELRRAATTAYNEKLYDLDDYAAAYVELFGATRLGERLLYEGRPVYGREAGLRLCALVDAGGASPPWRRYLDMARDDDPDTRRDDDERGDIAALRGAMRLWGEEEALERLAEWLPKAGEATTTYLVGLADLVTELFGRAALDQLIAHVGDAPPGVVLRLKLCAIQEATRVADHASARRTVRQVIDSVAELEAADLRTLFEAGIPGEELAERLPSLDDLADAVLASTYTADLGAVRRLRAALPILVGAGRDLAPLAARFQGEGWYRRWLRFLVALAEATDSAAVVAALEEVAMDTAPFVGQPRACDLYEIRGETEASFAQAFSRLADEDIADGLDAMLEVAVGTTTSLQRSPNGPLTIWAILRIVASRAEAVPIERIEVEVLSRWRNEYYDYHAETALRLATLYRRRGDAEGADDEWGKAAHYLASYGMRKDVTVFGLIEALDALAPTRPSDVIARMLRIRKLCDRAVYHTDGRETKHLPGRWMASLAGVAPARAALFVAETMRQDRPTLYWMTDEGLEDAMRAVHGHIPPLLEHLLWRCIPARRHFERRLEAVRSLLGEDRPRGAEAFAEAAAAIDGDCEHASPERTAALRAFADQHDLELPPVGEVEETRGSRDNGSGLGEDGSSELEAGPFLTGIDTTLKLLAWARGMRLDSFDRRIDHSALAIELRAKLDALGAAPNDIIAVVESLARHQLSLKRCDVLAQLADGYAESQPALAAELYVIAWCASRDRGGWERFGGLEHRDLVQGAANADVGAAVARLAREVAYVIDDDGYCLGMTRRLVEALVALGKADRGLDVWDRATPAVEYRLPETGGEPETWSEPPPELDVGDITHAYAYLLGAGVRNPHYDRRAAAFAGLAELVVERADLGTAALQFLLGRDSTCIDVLGALMLLRAFGEAAAQTRRALIDVLEMAAAAEPFGIQVTGARILEAERGSAPAPAGRPFRGRTVTWDEIERALDEDQQGRLEFLANLWNGVRRRVAERYWYLWECGESHASTDRAQSDVQFSRADGWVPPVPLWRWSRELFDCALHDVLPEMRSRLIVAGRWSRSGEEFIAEHVNPQAATAAARGRSRIVRPRLPLARRAEGGEREPLILDGFWSGFAVAAYWEDELIKDERRGGRRASVFAGLVAPPDDTGEGDLPFRSGRADFRWHRQGLGQGPERPATGRITSWWVQHDALAWDVVRRSARTSASSSHGPRNRFQRR
jgi:hypothetical protein